MYCSSSPVPSVATTRACVSPRVKSAEPCVRGSTPTSEVIGRTVCQVAAVDALAGADDVAAHDILLDPLEHGAEQHLLAGIGIGAKSSFLTLALDRLDQLVPLLLLR